MQGLGAAKLARLRVWQRSFLRLYVVLAKAKHSGFLTIIDIHGSAYQPTSTRILNIGIPPQAVKGFGFRMSSEFGNSTGRGLKLLRCSFRSCWGCPERGCTFWTFTITLVLLEKKAWNLNMWFF